MTNLSSLISDRVFALKDFKNLKKNVDEIKIICYDIINE